jgi:transcriptional regulator GlxA family with amidase domain
VRGAPTDRLQPCQRTRPCSKGFSANLACLRSRAHQELLESDPTVETVKTIALRWGFTNPGRFAALHAARYGEAPAMTLRRSPSRRIA